MINVIEKEHLFNDQSICIFTDSSFETENSNGVGLGTVAPSALVYYKDQLIDSSFTILHETTTVIGELQAILLGVMLSYKYRNYRIRLFSDNQFSIYAIRDYIFEWIRDKRLGSNKKDKIKNEEDIMSIVYYVLSNNIPIEFYHVKGHVNYKTKSGLKEAIRMFKTSNSYSINEELARIISKYNCCVDSYSTCMLKLYGEDPRYDTRGLTPAITIGYAPFDIYRYQTLINTNINNW